jgi:succinate-semialdehyde dehydrogenase/glutarate-semialdehyde dehydrogenase
VAIEQHRKATTWQEDNLSDYAVTNPATGELVKAYLTIGDAELADAIATADRAHRRRSARS